MNFDFFLQAEIVVAKTKVAPTVSEGLQGSSTRSDFRWDGVAKYCIYSPRFLLR